MTTTLNMVKTGKYANEKFFGVRHVQCFLCFLCLSLAYAWRVNLTVALAAMPVRPNHTMLNTTDDDVDVDRDDETEIGFSATDKPFLMSAFFWGYVVTQVPGGYIAQRYGAKMLLLLGLSACGILTLLTPLAIKLGGLPALAAVRVLGGLTQGAVHPATHALLSKWSPANERGLLGTLCYSGSQFGTIVTLATSGFIANSFAGWEGIFYVGGACGFLWVLFWGLFSASTPENHRSITREELKYIVESRSDGKLQDARELAPTPWKQILTSMPFLSLLLVHCTHMWGFWTLLTQIPNYMMHIYKIDIAASSLLSSLPYIVMMVLSFFFVWLSKVLQNNKSISLSFNRKFFNTIGHWIPMCSLIALGYVPTEDTTMAIVLLSITVGLTAATYLGFQVNHIDLSPNYAGTLMGITNAGANIMSAIAAMIVAYIVKDENNVEHWRRLFFLAAFFYFFGNLMFLVFGRTETQKWDSPDVVNEDNLEAGVPLSAKDPLPNGKA